MHGHSLARQMEEWWRDHAGRHDDPAWHTYLDNYDLLFRTKLDELRAEHTNNGRFGMSKASGCLRAAGLKFLGHPTEPFSGSTLATFHVGHLLELMAIATIQAMGHTTRGTQEPVTLEDFMSSYHDDIIENFDADGPVVLSVKTSAYKMSGLKRGGNKANPSDYMRRGFTELPMDGVQRAQSSWWAQAQAEMAGSGVHRTLVVAVAKDIVKVFETDPYMMENGSLTFYAEMIPFDPVFAASHLLPAWREAWADVQTGRPPRALVLNKAGAYVPLARLGDVASGWAGPNQAVTGSFNPCFGCDLQPACVAELASRYGSRIAGEGAAEAQQEAVPA